MKKNWRVDEITYGKDLAEWLKCKEMSAKDLSNLVGIQYDDLNKYLMPPDTSRKYSKKIRETLNALRIEWDKPSNWFIREIESGEDLYEWMKHNKLKNQDVAAMINRDSTRISAYLKADKIPSEARKELNKLRINYYFSNIRRDNVEMAWVRSKEKYENRTGKSPDNELYARLVGKCIDISIKEREYEKVLNEEKETLYDMPENDTTEEFRASKRKVYPIVEIIDQIIQNINLENVENIKEVIQRLNILANDLENKK